MIRNIRRTVDGITKDFVINDTLQAKVKIQKKTTKIVFFVL